MGTDINGWVEFEQYKKWYGVVSIRHLLHRNTDAFNCLFGVTNHARFRPIVPERGIPVDASEEVYTDEWLYEDSSYGHTWISLEEINAIDWDEYAKGLDNRVTQYHKDESGQWIVKSKSQLPNPPPIDKSQEGKVQVGDVLYEVRRMQRREVLPYWSSLFEIMRVIEKSYKNVRLVVYFDN